jgi:peptidoglycan/xylan/chitin deacetylase (PgdA/CDA1 family)
MRYEMNVHFFIHTFLCGLVLILGKLWTISPWNQAYENLGWATIKMNHEICNHYLIFHVLKLQVELMFKIFVTLI